MEFLLVWNDGRTEVVKGDSIHNAIGNAGYDVGDINDLKSWEKSMRFNVTAQVLNESLDGKWTSTTQIPTFSVEAFSANEALDKARRIIGPNLIPDSLCVEAV